MNSLLRTLVIPSGVRGARNLSVFYASLFLLPRASSPVDATKPAHSLNVRESIQVQAGERREVWTLQWTSSPDPYCPPAENSAHVCACRGFAYGERGKLQLIRANGQHKIETLDLTQFFGPAGLAIVQKWDILDNDTDDFIQHDRFADQVRRRPPVRIMRLKDYNHDGMVTKFFLQTGTALCGKILGVVVGISAKEPKLHAFGSARNPGKPLVLQKREWDALSGTNGETTIVDTLCGDHGIDEQTELTLKTKDGAISVESRDYACKEDGSRGEFLRSKEL